MATPAQTSANRTAWSLKKLPTISVPTPSQGQRRVSPARAGFYHMRLGDGPLGRPSPGELERRERPHELRMDGRGLALGALPLGRFRVRELEVGGHLLEVPEDALVDGALEHGQQCAQRL